MGKGNMFLGQVRGSVGDVTFWVARGGQMSRVRKREVGNPRSTAQQIQRMIFASVSWAYGVLKSICDHSWENVTYGGPSQAKFFSNNLRELRAYYPTDQDPDKPVYQGKSFLTPSREGSIGCGLQIAAGSLPEIRPIVSDAGLLIGFGSRAAGTGTATVAQVLSMMGAVAGDQITLVAVDENNMMLRSRYVVKSDATAGELAAFWSKVGAGDAFDSVKTEIDQRLMLGVNSADGQMYAYADTQAICVGIILSRKQGNKWLRSNTYLWNKLDEPPMYSAAYALPLWEMSGTDIETINRRYLNNADI